MGTIDFVRFTKNYKDGFIKVFLEFLEKKFSCIASSFDDEYFTIISEKDLLESLNYYIARNKITSRMSADNYTGAICGFFDSLSKDYNIENGVFSITKNYNHFIEESRNITSSLSGTISKDIASDESYESLINGIDEFLRTFDVNDVYSEISSLNSGSKKNAMIYHKFVSIIPCRLILKYALKSLTLVRLRLNNINMLKGTLDINGFTLPLDIDIMTILETYYKIRGRVLSGSISTAHDLLFVKPSGIPYVTSSESRQNITDYTSFFSIMFECTGTRSAETFAAKRMLELYRNGIDVLTISRLSQRPIEACEQILIDNSDSSSSRLYQYFNKESDYLPSEKMKAVCPFCGKSVSSISDNWVLVRIEPNGPKYISCRDCKGSAINET